MQNFLFSKLYHALLYLVHSTSISPPTLVPLASPPPPQKSLIIIRTRIQRREEGRGTHSTTDQLTNGPISGKRSFPLVL